MRGGGFFSRSGERQKTAVSVQEHLVGGRSLRWFLSFVCIATWIAKRGGRDYKTRLQ
jgi:hypothetical protein